LDAFFFGVPVVAAILGTEGSHALDGDLANIDRLFEAGYRVMGLHHFFDNKLGGSLHGQSRAGLTNFGRDAVARMRELSIVIDVAHSSEAVVRDVLAMGAGPLIVSHTGFDGHCPSPRNISDETMELIAENGGLIGVGFWEDVTCDASPAGIADAILWGARRFGVDHIALGSDFDGTVMTELDASELPAITQALLDAGMPEDDIRKVMGGNTVRFFLENLPSE
jgi:microsomal dipeptidase-like Zn-dependent dipeptidase